MIPSFKDYYSQQGNSWATKPTIALVPGSFKPPHKGHYDMIEQYANLAYNVLVLISAPSARSERKTKDGKVITPEIAKQILDIYTKHLTNVTIEISPTPSPVGAAYTALEDISENPPQETVGVPRVVLGAGKKDNDWRRWSGASDWAKKNGLNIDIVDPEITAVEVLEKPDGTPYSASSIRNNFDNPEAVASDLPDHVDPEQINKILSSI